MALDAAAEQRIQRALARGAILDGDHWRQRAASGEDVAILDHLAGTGPELRAAAPGSAAPFRTVAAAAPPAGADRIMFAANPVLDEMRRDKPALVAAAMREDPNPPRLFGDADLPPFTASGLDPAQLAGLPWPLRRPVAEAPTLAAAYELVDRYAGADGNDPELLGLRNARANVDYVQAMSQWLRGSGRTPEVDGPAPGGQPRHPATGQFTASAGSDDLTGDALRAELFGRPQ